jgi:hypothetical protein
VGWTMTATGNGETHGDGSYVDCPWCGEQMNMHDDATWASTGVDCEHCEQSVLLSHDVSIHVTARRDKPKQRSGPAGAMEWMWMDSTANMTEKQTETLISAGPDGAELWAGPEVVRIVADVGERELDESYELRSVLKQIRFADRASIEALRAACDVALNTARDASTGRQLVVTLAISIAISVAMYVVAALRAVWCFETAAPADVGDGELARSEAETKATALQRGA